jgi:hypothetical protein
MENRERSGAGIGSIYALQIAFIVLKLLGKIKWSWIWVLSPLWIYYGLALSLLIILAILRKRGDKK